MSYMTSTSTTALAPEAALDPIISELRARIVDAPDSLEGNEESRLHAEATLSTTFEVGRDGNVVGGFEQELQLARALATDTFVVVRVVPETVRTRLQTLGRAAEYLLGEFRTVEEKQADFGPMQTYGESIVSGYAGGGDYGTDQFLETRGAGEGKIIPSMSADVAPAVVGGRRALVAIANGVLRTVLRRSLPEVDPVAFHDLVDGGEGEEAGEGPRKLSSTPLRMCRYAGGADGVAFGAHTDTTFLTVIPCASAPGLEILQPSTGRWVRPEAARYCRPGSDVMLLSGELLQVFGRDRYRAAVHRVVRPVGATEPRVSTPLLVRGATGAVIRDSMLPPAVTARFEERFVEARRVEGLRENEAARSSSGVDDGKGRLTMTDLWKALQFRGGALSDEGFGGGVGGSGEAGGLEGLGGGDVVEEDGPSTSSSSSAPSSPPPPLAEAQNEEEIRALFEPFARGGVTVLSVDPLLVRLHGFASPEECALIIAEGLGTLEESTTWGGADVQAETDGLRSSATAWLADDSIAPLLATLTERVSGMSGLPSAFMEKWQVARYKPQGFFKLHTDHVEAFNSLVCGGRLGTLIIYLNDDFTGGQTDFPYVKVTVEPCTGDAIYFHSVVLPVEQEDAGTMKPDERSAHAGLAVEGGDKWIATKWIHSLPYPDGETAKSAARLLPRCLIAHYR
eukprot:g11375.t1